jgi:hypothetical protein
MVTVIGVVSVGSARRSVEEREHLVGGPGDHCFVALEHHRPLHQLGVLEQQVDDGLTRGVVVGVQAQLGESLVLAHELGRLVGDRIENALEVGPVERVLQVLDDVELDVAVVEDLQDAACLTSAGVVVHEELGHGGEATLR